MTLKVNNYFKNLGKSVAYATADRYKAKHEFAYKTTTGTAKLAKDTIYNVVHYKQTFKRVSDYVKKSQVYDVADFMYKSSIEDIKSGNIYNKSREDKLMEASMGGFDDDFDFNFDEDSGDINSAGTMTDGDHALKEAIEGTARASSTAVAMSVLSASKQQIEANKQSTNFMFLQNQRLFGELNSNVSTLGETMSNLLNFNTTVIKTHVDNSTRFYEESSKYQRENNAILKEFIEMERIRYKEEDDIRKSKSKRDKINLKTDLYSIINSNGTVDWGEYFTNVVKNVNEKSDMLGLGMLKDMPADQLKSMFASPLSFIPYAIAGGIMGPKLDKSISQLEGTLSNVFTKLAADLKAKGNREGGTWGLIADIFGINTNDKKSINTANYEKGRVPFDGVTRKSIVEVIPTHLARIEQLLGGEGNLYDYESGRWKTLNKIRKESDSDDERYERNKFTRVKKQLNNIKKRGNLSNESKDQIDDFAERLQKHLSRTNGSLEGFESRDSTEAKLLKSLDFRGVALDNATYNRYRDYDMKRREASGHDVRNSLYNGAFDSVSSKTNIGNAQLFNTSDTNGYLNDILVELKMIRNKNNKRALLELAKGRQTDIGINIPEGNTESRQTSYSKRESKSSSDDLEGRSLDDISIDELSNLSEDKYGIDKRLRTDKFKHIFDAKGAKSKGKMLFASLGELLRSPRTFIAESITALDDTLYEFFFTHETNLKDKDGKPVTGLFDRIGYHLKDTFDEFKNWAKRSLWDPIKKWGTDFIKGMGLDRWFGSAKTAASDNLHKATNGAFGTADMGSRLSDFLNNNKSETDVNSAPPIDLWNIASNIQKKFGGAAMVNKSGLTAISKGEMIIPADMNPFNLDRDKVSRQKNRADEDNIITKFVSSMISKNADGNIAYEYGKKSSEGIGKAASWGKDKLLEFAAQHLSKDKNSKFRAELSGLFGDSSKTVGKIAPYAGIGGALGLFLPGGPLIGAIAGSAYSILKDSELFKSFLFGEAGEDGIRNGGIISKGAQATLKKYAPDMFKGAGIGAVAGLVTPFGPVGGAILGSAINFARNSEDIQERLFGAQIKDKDGKVTGRQNNGLVSNEVVKYVKKSIPMMGVATLGTLIAGPAGLGLMGSMVLGSGIGLLTASETFRNAVLGEKDKDGKGRVGGLVSGIKLNIIDPLAEFGANLKDDFWSYMRKDIFNPLGEIFKNSGQLLHAGFKDFKYTVADSMERAMANAVGIPLARKINDAIFNPAKFIGKSIIGPIVNGSAYAVGRVISAPLKGLAGLTRRGTKGLIESGKAIDMTAIDRLNFAKENGFNYGLSEQDAILSNLDKDSLEALRSNMIAAQGHKAIRSEYNKTRQSAYNILSDPALGIPKSEVRRIMKMAESGDINSAKVAISKLNIPADVKSNLYKQLEKKFSSMSNLKGKEGLTNIELDNMKSTIKEKFGLDIDVTDRKSLGFMESILKTEISSREADETLKKKDPKEDAVDTVSQGMKETNNILLDIRDNLIKLNGGNTSGSTYTDAKGIKWVRSTDGTWERADGKEDKKKQEEEKKDNSSDILNELKKANTEKKDKRGFLQKTMDMLTDSPIGLALGGGLLSAFVPDLGNKVFGVIKFIGEKVLDGITLVGKTITDKLIEAVKTIPETISYAITSGFNHILGYFTGDSSFTEDAGGIIETGKRFLGGAGTALVLGGLADTVRTRGKNILRAGRGVADAYKAGKSGGFKAGAKELGRGFGHWATGGHFFNKITDESQAVMDTAETNRQIADNTSQILNVVSGGKLGGGIIPDLGGTANGGPTTNKGRNKANKNKVNTKSSKGGKITNFLKNKNLWKVAAITAATIGLNYAEANANAPKLDENGQPIPGDGNDSGGFTILNAVSTAFDAYSTYQIADMVTFGKLGNSLSKLKDFGFDKLKTLSSGVKLSKGADLLTKNTGKVTNFLRSLVSKSLGLICKGSPKLAKLIGSGLESLGSRIVKHLLNPKIFTKISTKVSSAIGVSAGTAGIGALVIGAAQTINIGASIANGYDKWYNIAGVLANEEVSDDIKWICALANGLDALLFDVIGAEYFANILFDAFGINLSGMKAKAKQAVDEYNSNPVSHKDGQPARVENVQEYNDKVLNKTFWEGLKDKGNGIIEGLSNVWQSIKNTASNIGSSIWKKGGEIVDSAKDMASRAADAVGNTVSKGATAVKNFFTGEDSSSGDNPKGKFGTSKFFRQTDSQWTNKPFNIYGDTERQTIGDSGCGPVAGANAILALGKGNEPNPIEASKFAIDNNFKGINTGTDPRFFSAYAKSHGAMAAPVGTSGMVNALRNGNPVVIEGESRTGTISGSHPFGSYPHYVTATGLNADGTVNIQDPEGKSGGSKYDLKQIIKNTNNATVFARGKRFGRGKGSTIVKSCWNFLISCGVSEVATAAILGNIYQESKFKLGAVSSDGHGSYGLCQWTDARLDALNAMAANLGLSPGSLEAQLKYLWHELNNSESESYNAIKDMGDVDKATETFCRLFERPNMAYANLPVRQGFARKVLEAKGDVSEEGFDDASFIAAGTKSKSKDSGLFGFIKNKMKSAFSPILDAFGLTDFFGSEDESSGSANSSPVTATGDLKTAVDWANSMVGKEGYGPNGCSEFVNNFLERSKAPKINMYVPNAYTAAKSSNNLKSSDNGALGDVAIVETDGNWNEPDHVVINDGQGGFWGNSSKENTIVHDKWGNYFGKDQIWGFINSGDGKSSSLPNSKGDMAKSAEEAGPTSQLLATGKRGLFGRGGGIPTSDVIKERGYKPSELSRIGLTDSDITMADNISNELYEKTTKMANMGLSAYGRGNMSSYNTTKYSNIPQAVYGRGVDDSNSITLIRAYLDQVVSLLGGINTNTAGIGTLNQSVLASNANTNQQIQNLKGDFQSALGTVYNSLDSKVGNVATQVQSQITKAANPDKPSYMVSSLQTIAAK